jgi:predicted Zn-dependent protease
MIARLAVAVLAVVVLAWLGVMERDRRLLERGVEAAGSGQFPRAEADLRAARLLNPDTAPDLSRAVLYQGAGRLGEADAVLRDVVRREPDNRTAWALMLAVSRGRDAGAERRALAALRRIDPVNAARRPPAEPR